MDARPAERGDEFCQAARRIEAPLGAVIARQRLRPGGMAVEQRHAEAVTRRIARQIGAHHRQSNNAKIRRAVACHLPFS